MSNGKKFAFMMGRITPAKEREAVQRLWKLDSVDDVQLTYGKYDFVVKVHFSNFETFFESYLQVKHIPEIKTEKILIAYQNLPRNQVICKTLPGSDTSMRDIRSEVSEANSRGRMSA